jgi:hypothetical protein
VSTTANGFRYPEPTDPPAIDQDIKRLAQDVDSKAVLKTGSTMSGALTLPGEPTSINHAATKGYVDKRYTPRILTYTPSDRQWNTTTNFVTPSTGTSPCWIYNLTAPYPSGMWQLVATLTFRYDLAGENVWGLRTTAKDQPTTYRKSSWFRVGAGDGSVTLVVADILAAGTGVGVKLETNATNSQGTNYLTYQNLVIQAFPYDQLWGY